MASVSGSSPSACRNAAIWDSSLPPTAPCSTQRPFANETGVTLHRYDLKKRTAVLFTKGVAAFSVSANGKKALLQTGDKWMVVGTDVPPKEGDGKLKTDVRMQLDPPAEWRQIFKEAWRYERDFFYVKNLHGADWNKVYAMYSPWVEHVGHRSDLTHLLDILGGELSVGHSFTGGGDLPEVPPGHHRHARGRSEVRRTVATASPTSSPGKTGTRICARH